MTNPRALSQPTLMQFLPYIAVCLFVGIGCYIIWRSGVAYGYAKRQLEEEHSATPHPTPDLKSQPPTTTKTTEL